MNTQLQHLGYLLITGESPNPLQYRLNQQFGHAYRSFHQSWNGLLRDRYLRDGGNYRFRRYSVFHWKNNHLTVLPHEPHYQSSHYNSVHGGFNRHFRAWLPTTLRNPVLPEIIRWTIKQFKSTPLQLWRIQAHQFRIVAHAEQCGKPTPEGVHKDGADYILIMLLNRHNVHGGVSHIYDNAMHPLVNGVLQVQGDIVLVNDHEVYHGVTEIVPDNPAQPAWRDVLVLTFHKQ